MVASTPGEWIKQAEYDMETAQAMFDAARYFYVVFMCHLTVEKALKGAFASKLGQMPPKTHNLLYLMKRIGVSPPEATGKFLVRRNEASVATRHPESLDVLRRDFTADVVKRILSQTRETLLWIKTLL